MRDLQGSKTSTPARFGRAPKARVLPASDHDLTLIIPAFNEEQRLPNTLTETRAFLNHWGLDYRVLVADDGSRDRTAALAAAFGSRFSTLSLPQQRGKGCAVRTAMLAARGRVVAFTDADLPYDLAALRQGYETIRAGECQVVLGARDMVGAVHLAPRRLARRIATYLFREIVKRLVSREVTDTQCGLKLFSRQAAVEIFSRATIDGFAFDAELVFLMHQLRLSFRRIPVSLINEYSSTLSLSRHALPMLMDVIRMRRRAWRGEHGLSLPPFVFADTAEPADRKMAA